ncbi:hypothetical protein [Okeania sp. KiyG1]|nr:hypothetical protein [Okeania sp. KiyG1]
MLAIISLKHKQKFHWQLVVLACYTSIFYPLACRRKKEEGRRKKALVI